MGDACRDYVSEFNQTVDPIQLAPVGTRGYDV